MYNKDNVHCTQMVPSTKYLPPFNTLYFNIYGTVWLVQVYTEKIVFIHNKYI